MHGGVGPPRVTPRGSFVQFIGRKGQGFLDGKGRGKDERWGGGLGVGTDDLSAMDRQCGGECGGGGGGGECSCGGECGRGGECSSEVRLEHVVTTRESYFGCRGGVVGVVGV